MIIPTTGDFTLEFSADGNSYSGSWTFEGRSDVYPWNGTRLNSERPDPIECVLLAPRGDLEGRWESPGVYDWDICIEDDEYLSSYSTLPEGGYEIGKVYLDGLVLSGYFVDESTQAISMNMRLLDGRLLQFFWESEAGQPLDPNEYNVVGEHGVVQFLPVPDYDVESSSCIRNIPSSLVDEANVSTGSRMVGWGVWIGLIGMIGAICL